MRIAALFVQHDGVYADLPGVELWDITRDARDNIETLRRAIIRTLRKTPTFKPGDIRRGL